MAISERIGNLRFVPKAAAGSSAGPRYALDDIDYEVQQEVEEGVQLLSENPDGRLHVEFMSEQALKVYLGMVASYCEVKGYYFRKSPVKGQRPTEASFRVETMEARERREKLAAEAAAKREANKAEVARALHVTPSAVSQRAPVKKATAAKK